MANKVLLQTIPAVFSGKNVVFARSKAFMLQYFCRNSRNAKNPEKTAQISNST